MGDGPLTEAAVVDTRRGEALSVFETAIFAGDPIGVEIIDAHAHLMAGSGPDVLIPYASPAGMVEAMDRYGIDKACISVTGSGDANDATKAAVAEFPERFIGFHLVNPRYPDLVDDELRASFASPGFLGLGEIHATSYGHDYPITGRAYMPAWEFAEEHRLPVLIHSGPKSEIHRCRPADLGAVAQAHPDMNVLIGHCGGYDSWELLDEAIETARCQENVYLEICAMGRHFGALEYLVQKLGSEKIVYGSDAPFHDWSAEIAHVAFARIPDDTKAKVFGGTMMRLLEEVR